MIGSTALARIGVTGLGTHVPERVLTNDELAEIVETTDEWIQERTGIRERRIAAEDEALTDIALPAAAGALADAGVDPADIDLLDLRHGHPGHDVPDVVGAARRRAGDAEGCGLRPPRGLHRVRLRDRSGVRDARLGSRDRALVVGGDVLSKILDWEDRSTLVLFGDGAGAVVMEPVESGGFLGFELGADGGGGEHLWLPGLGLEEPSRTPRRS